MKKRINAVTTLFSESGKILTRHSSLLFLQGFQSIFLLTIIGFFILPIIYIEWKNLSTKMLIYYIFTLYWVYETFYYVLYMTTAGVVANDIFFKGTSQENKYPVLSSFKRAMTYTFGTAAFAGVILAVIKVLHFLVESLNPKNRKKRNSDDDKNQNLEILLDILYCCLKSLLNIIESNYRYMTRNALIYCAVFGLPYQQACRRWINKGFQVRIDQYYKETMINYTIIVIQFFIILLSVFVIAVLTFIIGEFSHLDFNDIKEIILKIIPIVIVFTLIINKFMMESLTIISDTIMLIYFEEPKRVEKNFPNLSTLNNLHYE